MTSFLEQCYTAFINTISQQNSGRRSGACMIHPPRGGSNWFRGTYHIEMYGKVDCCFDGNWRNHFAWNTDSVSNSELLRLPPLLMGIEKFQILRGSIERLREKVDLGSILKIWNFFHSLFLDWSLCFGDHRSSSLQESLTRNTVNQILYPELSSTRKKKTYGESKSTPLSFSCGSPKFQLILPTYYDSEGS